MGVLEKESQGWGEKGSCFISFAGFTVPLPQLAKPLSTQRWPTTPTALAPWNLTFVFPSPTFL